MTPQAIASPVRPVSGTLNGAGSVRIFNVKYSPNLGDGLLSECLEHALITCGADPDTRSIDLAGRTAYGPGPASRSAQMALLEALPAPVRRQAVRVPIALAARQRWRPHYRAELHGADAVVIGGGNLIADLDLNFPSKIALAVSETAARGLPAVIYACGVSDHWSSAGRALLDRALDRGAIRRVFVRDERSRVLWDGLAGDRHGLPATIVRDPGLLAAERYGAVASLKTGGDRLVGLNITSPVALRYHAQRAPEAAELESWYLDLARDLLRSGHRVMVFSNGSPEDRSCLQHLAPAFSALADQFGGPQRLTFSYPATPAQLTSYIAGLDALVAFRMHAVIAAYACDVPFVALSWDPKLESFVQSVGFDEWLVSPSTTPAEEAARMVEKVIGKGIAPAIHANVIAEARDHVAMLHAELVRHSHAPAR